MKEKTILKNVQEDMTSISYKIYKDGKHLGSLLGSFHNRFETSDYTKLLTSLEPLIKEVKYVYLECPLPEYKQLPLGFERAVLEICEKTNLKDKLKYFESLEFQKAMLASAFWFGRKICLMPWHQYKLLCSKPKLFLSLSTFSLKFFRIYNIFYNLFFFNQQSLAVQEHTKEQEKVASQMYLDFQNKKASSLSEFDRRFLLMLERDTKMAELISKSLKPDSLQAFIVGVCHLPGENGLVKKLQEKGFSLKPWDYN